MSRPDRYRHIVFHIGNYCWRVKPRSQGNSSYEVWPLDWGFMVGTASDRDFYQSCLQCAGSHRSGRQFPVAESVANHALRMHSDHSPLSH